MMAVGVCVEPVMRVSFAMKAYAVPSVSVRLNAKGSLVVRTVVAGSAVIALPFAMTECVLMGPMRTEVPGELTVPYARRRR